MTASIYLDYAATTPMDISVIEKMTDTMRNHYGNASSIHQYGRNSKKLLEHARKTVAEYINALPEEIIFTSGGTESDNTAILMGAHARSDRGRHIITTAVEHEAVLKPLKRLEAEGFEVTYLPVGITGELDFEHFKEAVRQDTILVSIMSVNNEVGTIFPIEKIGAFLSERDILFHTDAVQAFGPLKIDVKKAKIDLLSASAHKIYGPKGVGFLYKRKNIAIPSFMLGGNQERKQRAGTENLPAIVGFEQAVCHMKANRAQFNQHAVNLREQLIYELNHQAINFQINGNLSQQVPHIINLYFPNKLAEQLLIQLDLKQIAVSAGSACTAGSIKPSHVLQSMYGDQSDRLMHSIRVSMGAFTTEKDIKDFVKVLKEIV
nr:cysteine desulfurase family protein [Allofustis seminis]